MVPKHEQKSYGSLVRVKHLDLSDAVCDHYAISRPPSSGQCDPRTAGTVTVQTYIGRYSQRCDWWKRWKWPRDPDQTWSKSTPIDTWKKKQVTCVCNRVFVAIPMDYGVLLGQVNVWGFFCFRWWWLGMGRKRTDRFLYGRPVPFSLLFDGVQPNLLYVCVWILPDRQLQLHFAVGVTTSPTAAFL